MDHALLPQPNEIRNANLPVSYQNARVALAECNRIDEWKDWEDKAQALASYAKQSKNKELEKMAMRIRARAGERCGAMLAEFERANGRPLKSSSKDELMHEAASQAGLSPKQAQTRLRIHDAKNKDPEAFEAQLESDSPPTITSLAEQGKKKGIPRKGRECAGFWKGEGLDHLEVPIAQERAGATGSGWLPRVGTPQRADGACIGTDPGASNAR